MGEFEEETYSTVFKALRHPVRRRLLRTLSQGPRSFTDLQSSFKVNSAVLTFHLDSMKDLVCKTEDGKYILSTMGEGAMALMERVEEPPKVASTKPSHKNSRRLSILQSATICIAVVFLVSGTYLTSISLVQEFYDVPVGWALATDFYSEASVNSDWIPVQEGATSGVSIPDFYNIDGNSYDMQHLIWVEPRNQLLNQLTYEYEADIYVNLKTNETAPSGVYDVTLNYLEHSPVDDMYHQKQRNYRGEVQPAENSNEIAFSTHITLPYAIINKSVPRGITISIWTNATTRASEPAPELTDFLSVKATATDEFHSETYPYENQGNIITTVGITLVAAALIMYILPLLRKQT
jgi:DNA-binding transcriptional ArsR family regulator